MEDTRYMDRCFLEKPLGRQPLERPKRRWKDNIKMDLNQVVSDLY
jgi:hypothetical protein